MFARLATFLMAGAMILPAASAQAPTAAPDPALDLARLLMSRDQTLYDDADLGRFRVRIANALLGTESSCSPANADCQALAVEIAGQFAAALRQSQRDRSERLTAATLARRMSPGEMAHVAAWLRSDEGGHFVDAWGSLRDPDSVRERHELRDPAQSAPAIMNPARALFRQRSRNLPQPAPR
jgi:hypothetical protein